MEQQEWDKLLELLDTISEAQTHLKNTENEELRHMMHMGRLSVTEALEAALNCSLDQRVNVSQMSDEDWLRTAYRIMGELADPFQPKNSFDLEFQSLLDHIWELSEDELLSGMKVALKKMRKASQETYDRFVEYFARFPLWGTFRPDRGDWTTLELRAMVLKRHSYDFLWLYRRVEDYLSKRTLTAILRNWTFLDFDYPSKVKSIFPDYWEPDVFPDNRGDVLVDVGAYIGDSIANYLNMYGTNYRKIYAYEISADSYAKLCENIEHWGLHDTSPRRKGVGAERGKMFVHANADASANQLKQDGEGDQVEIVPLDEDAPDATFIKMDIEGAEQTALLGCERIIRSHHPKLAICIYHGYEDIWKIPAMVDEMDPDYRFYLRHNGGNLIPTEFVLLCRR